MGELVEMKIHNREPTVEEKMNNAIKVSAESNRKPIDYFELTIEELNSNYSNFTKTQQYDGNIQYSYKTIPIKVKQ